MLTATLTKRPFPSISTLASAFAAVAARATARTGSRGTWPRGDVPCSLARPGRQSAMVVSGPVHVGARISRTESRMVLKQPRTLPRTAGGSPKRRLQVLRASAVFPVRRCPHGLDQGGLPPNPDREEHTKDVRRDYLALTEHKLARGTMKMPSLSGPGTRKDQENSHQLSK